MICLFFLFAQFALIIYLHVYQWWTIWSRYNRASGPFFDFHCCSFVLGKEPLSWAIGCWTACGVPIMLYHFKVKASFKYYLPVVLVDLRTYCMPSIWLYFMPHQTGPSPFCFASVCSARRLLSLQYFLKTNANPCNTRVVLMLKRNGWSSEVWRGFWWDIKRLLKPLPSL